MNVGVIGMGYVGLVVSVCFGKFGNEVVCIDKDVKKIQMLKEKVIPFYEPQLEGLFIEVFDRLNFSNDITTLAGARIIFICVDTPSYPNGSVDLSNFFSVAEELVNIVKDDTIVVQKSTAPVGTNDKLDEYFKEKLGKRVELAVNPEFLREGNSVADFMRPARIVIGVRNKGTAEVLKQLYQPIEAPIMVVSPKEAEFIKYAANAFLALKISYVNALACLCDKIGCDIDLIIKGLSYDSRIGGEYLRAGVGYGGSCLPKDTRSIIYTASQYNYQFNLLKEVEQINLSQRNLIISYINQHLNGVDGKLITILGLSFKPNTDDIREAPAITIVPILKSMGAKVKVYDPKAMDNAKRVLEGVEFCVDAYSSAEASDCLVILTDWEEFTQLDWRRIKNAMRGRTIIDGRNMLDKQFIQNLGFIYKGVGR